MVRYQCVRWNFRGIDASCFILQDISHTTQTTVFTWELFHHYQHKNDPFYLGESMLEFMVHETDGMSYDQDLDLCSNPVALFQAGVLF